MGILLDNFQRKFIYPSKGKRLRKKYYKLKREQDKLNAENERFATDRPNLKEKNVVKIALKLRKKKRKLSIKATKLGYELACWEAFTGKKHPAGLKFQELMIEMKKE